MSLWWRRGLSGCRGVRGTEYNSSGISAFEGGHHYRPYPYHSLASAKIQGGNTAPSINSYEHWGTNMSLRPWFYFFEHLYASGIAGSYYNSMFNFLRFCYTFFPSSEQTILHFHQQCTKILISPHLCQHLSSSLFF